MQTQVEARPETHSETDIVHLNYMFQSSYPFKLLGVMLRPQV